MPIRTSEADVEVHSSSNSGGDADLSTGSPRSAPATDASTDRTLLARSRFPCCYDRDGRSTHHGSRNVPRVLLYTFMDGACYSLWGMQALPLYLLDITQHATTVGTSATISGVAQLFGAAAAGYVADRHSRLSCVRAASLCGLSAFVVLLVGIGYHRVAVIFGAQALYGLYCGIASTSVEALFADSVPTGQRIIVYNRKWILQTLSYIVGYVIAVLFFFETGNTWTEAQLRAVLSVGVVLHPVALLFLCGLREVEAVPADEDAVLPAAASARASRHTARSLLGDHAVDEQVEVEEGERERMNLTNTESAAPQRCGAEGRALFQLRNTVSGINDDDAQAKRSTDNVRSPVTPVFILAPAATLRRSARLLDSFINLSMVPYWMCLVDLLLAIGSGLSLPYFPPFFAAECGFSPVQLYLLYIASTLLTALTSSLLPWLIRQSQAGRVPTVMGVRIVGTAALLVLARASAGSIFATPWSTTVLFLCRNACMNAVFGVTRSVMMDCVAKDARARWSALESVSSLSWAGSAAMGGLLTERYGYRVNFAVTAAVQLTATLLMLPAAVGARALDAAPVATTAAVLVSREETETP